MRQLVNNGYTVRKETSILTGETKWVARYNGERIGAAYSKAQANAHVTWHKNRQK